MKNLIVYYSLTRNNELLAKELQKRLSCDLLQIQEQSRKNKFTLLIDLVFKRAPKLVPHGFSIGSYDQLILVAPVWAGKIAAPLRTFLESERHNVKRYSFITACGGAEGQKEKIISELSAVVRKKPVAMKEIWISKLLAERNESVIDYRLSQTDIESLSDQIEGFVAANQSAQFAQV